MVEIKMLENGLRIVFEELPYVRSIAFGVWVHNGTRNESNDENGISHFIEHMLFKGTKKRTAKDIAEEMDSVGGQINAYTTKEYTCYHTRVLDKHFDAALDVLSDMILQSRFDDSDIKKELNVIIEEIDMYEDDPEELVHDKLQEMVWNKSSLGMPILGTKESISKINSQKLFKYYNSHYYPQNTVVAVVGNFNSNEMLEKLNTVFGSWSNEKSISVTQDKTAYIPQLITVSKDIEQVHLCLAFPSFERDSKYKYSMAVLNTIFGGGMSSRLFQKIREEHGLAYSIYSYITAYSDGGLFCIYAGMNPNQVEKAIHLIVEEMKILQTEIIPDILLSKTKEQIISNYIIGTESTSNRLTSAGGSMLLRNKIISIEEVISMIESITSAEIKNLAKIVFDLSQISISAVGKVKGIDFERILKDEGINTLYHTN